MRQRRRKRHGVARQGVGLSKRVRMGEGRSHRDKVFQEKGFIMNMEVVWNFLSTQGADFGLKILGAIAAWVVGRWLIALAVRLIGAALEKGRKIDATLTQYLKSIISVLLTLVLVLAILDIFGIKTTSFAALLAGAGLAIGAAWSGMLGNFAAGLFLQVLRPYKVGDFINAGGTLGTVKELGLFATTVLTPDNVLTVVGNNKVFADNVQNFSAEPYRRVDCVAKVANSVDVMDAMARLRPVIAAIPNVKAEPAPDVEILQFTPEGPLLCVRPYTHTDHYWQVYFDTNKAIVTTFGTAGYPVPETPMAHRTV
jgi:small conductance mechanosensitive channel